MPTVQRLSVVLLLAVATALPGCQLTESSSRGKPRWDESVPRKVATREAESSGGGSQLALVLTNAQGKPGSEVSVTAKLNTGGSRIAGTQNDIVFDPGQVSVARDSRGNPDCSANRSIKKDATAFSFVPKNCGNNCTTVRALVLALNNVDPIPNGSTLYTCRVRIADRATAGAHQLKLTRVGFSTPAGESVNGGSENAAITVSR